MAPSRIHCVRLDAAKLELYSGSSIVSESAT